jgi:hypothetical protein
MKRNSDRIILRPKILSSGSDRYEFKGNKRASLSLIDGCPFILYMKVKSQ